jgi:hypothetical protein
MDQSFFITTVLNHFLITTMLSHFSLLQCSVIFHCYSAQPFLGCYIAQSFLVCYNAHNFPLLQCSAIPHATVISYSPFATVLIHSSLLQCARPLSHFTKCLSGAYGGTQSFCKITERRCECAGQLVARSRRRAGGRWLATRFQGCVVG